MQNIISWFEVPVKDMLSAAMFYSKVLNNKIEIVNILGVDYGMFDRKEGLGGTLIKSANAIGGGVLLFFFTPDISTSLEKVIVYGGKVIQPKTLMKKQYAGKTVISKTMIDNEIGYYAIVEDSEGNKIALHSHS